MDSARIWAKPASGSGCTQASAPPATTTSARPERSSSSATASASAPDAQALTGQCTPARAPISRPTVAAGPFGMSIGTRCGLTRRGPFSRRTSSWPRIVSAPPMPEPMTTASRSGVDVGAARVGPGLAGGDERHLLDAVERARLDPLQPAVEVDGGGQPRGQVGELRLVEQPHAGAAAQQPLLERGDVGTERGEGAEARDGRGARRG